MTTRLVFIFLLFSSTAWASNQSIEAYVPPPMFDNQASKVFPPLPPRRPEKINVPQSYIDYMRKYGRAPALIQPSSNRGLKELQPENLIQPSAQDILDQIDPQ